VCEYVVHNNSMYNCYQTYKQRARNYDNLISNRFGGSVVRRIAVPDLHQMNNFAYWTYSGSIKCLRWAHTNPIIYFIITILTSVFFSRPEIYEKNQTKYETWL